MSLEEIVPELRDAQTVTAAQTLRHETRLKEHQEWLEANELGNARYREKMAELDDYVTKIAAAQLVNEELLRLNALPEADQSRIREKVELFNTFHPGNDPYGERDLGSFEHNGVAVMWKIDYYDKKLEFGSEHPEDPAQTTRVLTIMLWEEY